LNYIYIYIELVEKFRYIGVNGSDTTNPFVVGEKNPCNGCSRQTPINELFFCKTCAFNGLTDSKSLNIANDSVFVSTFENENKKVLFNYF
jgi:hypothetical protein